MARDDFKTVTIERLATRVNDHCSNPNCAAPTSGPSFADEGTVSIGVAAHITAASPGGPRFDKSLTPEQRQAFSNGIWLCNNCSRKVDGDPLQYDAPLLRQWKQFAEMATAKAMGVPTVAPQSNLARIAPARRFGAQGNVIVENRIVSYAHCGLDSEWLGKICWFVQGFAFQFKIQKRDAFASVVVDGFEATVHRYAAVPEFQTLYGVYPIESSLYLVEIDRTLDDRPRQFTANRYFENMPATDSEQRREIEHVAAPVVLDTPALNSFVVRFDARTPGLYVVSLDVLLSAGEMSERIEILQPQEVIFDAEVDDE